MKNKKPLAVITGASGGMGTCIVRAVAAVGYPVLMVCHDPGEGCQVRDLLTAETGNGDISVDGADFRDLSQVRALAGRIAALGRPVGLLMNNAGTMPRQAGTTRDGLNEVVSVNYAAPWLLTSLLLPLMEPGARIVNMVSVTYGIGRIDPATFFETGGGRRYRRIPVYGNTKLALLLFTQELAGRLASRGITVNAADPGIVDTKFIHLDRWFDPLSDIFFRPLIRKAEQGAATAIHLLLSPEAEGVSGRLYANCRPVDLAAKYTAHPRQKSLWEDTELCLRELHQI